MLIVRRVVLIMGWRISGEPTEAFVSALPTMMSGTRLGFKHGKLSLITTRMPLVTDSSQLHQDNAHYML